jgi:hypothetical protein
MEAAVIEPNSIAPPALADKPHNLSCGNLSDVIEFVPPPPRNQQNNPSTDAVSVASGTYYTAHSGSGGHLRPDPRIAKAFRGRLRE